MVKQLAHQHLAFRERAGIAIIISGQIEQHKTRDLSELEDFYERVETRMEDFNDKLNSVAVALLNVRAEKEIFAHPAKAKKLIQCRDDIPERTTDFYDDSL